MRTVLITGASRGIGLGLVGQFLGSGDRVIATARHPATATALNTLLQEHNAEAALPLDVTSDESIRGVADQLRQKGITLDILINNAGMSNSTHPVDPPDAVDRAEMATVLSTNVTSVAKVTELLGILAPGKIVVNISSVLGSIANNSVTGGTQATSYRCSKAALNMLTKCFSVQFPETIFVMVHPGWVATDMGSSGGRTADISVEESTTGIHSLVNSLTSTHSGKFLNWKGAELPF